MRGLLALLVVLAPAPLASQSFPSIGSDARAGPGADPGERRSPQKLSAWWGMPARARNQDGRLGWQRGKAELAFPIYPSGDFSLFGQASFDYLRLDDSRDILPPRLIKAGLGLTALVPLPAPAQRLIVIARYDHRSDFDRVSLGQAAFSLGAFASFRLDEAWTLSTGLYYASDYNDPRLRFLRYVPLPGVQATYRPNDRLGVVLGLPNNEIYWRPLDWLELRARYFPPERLDVSLTQRPAQWLTFRQYFGRVQETWDLIGRRYPEDSVAFIEGYAAGLVAECAPATWITLRVQYQLGFATRTKLYQSREEKTFDYLKLAPGHALGLAVEISF